MSKSGINSQGKWVKPIIPKAPPKKEAKKVSKISSRIPTSTPMPNKQPQPMIEPDISALESLSGLSISTTSGEDITGTGSTKSTVGKNKDDAENDHDRTMNAFSRYLQAAMMNIQAKKALQRLKSDGVTSIAALANHVYELKDRLHKLKISLEKIKSLKLLKQQFDQQNEVLGRLHASVGILDNYYILSNCVDDCSHKLPVRDIATDKEEIECLVEKLNTSTKLVEELAAQASLSGVSEDAEALTNLSDILEETADSVHKCDESLEKFTSLGIHATSLQMQNIQGTL